MKRSIEIMRETTFTLCHCYIYHLLLCSCSFFQWPIVSSVILLFFSRVNTSTYGCVNTPIIGCVNTPFFQSVNTPFFQSVNTPFFPSVNASLYSSLNTPLLDFHILLEI